MTDATIAALRAYAAGLYPDEAGIELLIGHGGFLHRARLRPLHPHRHQHQRRHHRWPGSTGSAVLTACTTGRCPSPAANGASSSSPPASPRAPASACATPSPAWTTATSDS